MLLKNRKSNLFISKIPASLYSFYKFTNLPDLTLSKTKMIANVNNNFRYHASFQLFEDLYRRDVDKLSTMNE